MNSGPILFLGLFIAMSCSWLSFILGPQLQFGNMLPTTNIVVGKSGQIYPEAVAGLAHQGAEVYRASGCVSCHTQQVRPRSLGSDIHRGWGVRRSTGYDYLFDQPVLLGAQRIGPDLANAGQRMDAAAVLLRLYNPRIIMPGSLMPPYSYLFEQRKIGHFHSAQALALSAPFAPPDGYEIVPTPAALALATYVASLHQDGYLFEAPPPASANPAKTNSPAPAAAAVAP